MKIQRISTQVYRLPLKEKWISAKYVISEFELVLTEIETDGGLRGTGWYSTIGAGGLSIQRLLESYLSPLLIGEDAWNTERIWDRLWGEVHLLGPAGLTTLAIGTIDIALWDLRAQAAHVPLYVLLGGMRDEVPVYASAINLHLAGDELLKQTEGFLRQGYSTFKIKIGRNDPEEDLARLRAVRGLIGPKRELLVDVNQRWKAGEAVARCRQLLEVNPGWIEEPLLSDDVDGHVHVRANGGIPVAIGEQLCHRFEFMRYIRREAADILQPHVAKVGGITEWMKIAHLAQAANLPMAPNAVLELSMHLIAAIANGYMVENILGSNLADLGIAEPVEVRNGRIRLPDRPGHGTVFDWSALARYRVDPATVFKPQATTHQGL